MNYMKDVAQLLGLEIGEEFKIEDRSDNEIYRLTGEDLEYFSSGQWFKISGTLAKLLNDQYKIVKLPKPVLDDVEKEYLSTVIKPFRHRIKYFYKYPCVNGDSEAISAITKDCGYLDFPRFKKGSMYKGMELNKKYTLGELSL